MSKTILTFRKRYDKEVGNVVIYDSQNDKKIFVSPNKLENYKSSRYTPIGIIVIPFSHDVYGTGEAAMMALRYMNPNDPNNGSLTPITMSFGLYNRQLSEINYDKSPNYGLIINGIQYDTLQEPINESSLPNDFNDGEICLKNKKLRFATYSESELINYPKAYGPSPYNLDGSRNPDYCDTIKCTIANGCSDFSGKEMSEKIWKIDTLEENWKTKEILTSTEEVNYSPTLCCCWRYFTPGTKQGDWYLPAAGELGYLGVRRNYFNSIFDKINNIWNNFSAKIYATLLRSTTEMGANVVRYLDTTNSNITFYGKKYMWYSAIPFCRITKED